MITRKHQEFFCREINVCMLIEYRHYLQKRFNLDAARSVEIAEYSLFDFSK